MEVSQRGEVQRTHNAGLVVTVVLELVALILLGVLECFFRQVYTVSSSVRRDGDVLNVKITRNVGQCPT